MSYIEKLGKNKFYNLFIFILFLSLIIGFMFNENSTGGAYQDYIIHDQISNSFVLNFNTTFFNYDELKTRHSPIIPIFFGYFKILNISDFFVRFLNLFNAILLIIIFYKCLRIIFKNIKEIKLFFFCCILFLSPTVRSLAIWPDSHLYGLIFFLISIFYYLKFRITRKSSRFKYVILNILFLALCSYIRPSFAIFSIFFFYEYFKEFKFSKKIVIIVFLNLLLSAPAFYYLFILDVMFLSTHANSNIDILTRLNLSNKIMIISSIILFHLLPILFINFRYFKNKFLDFKSYDFLIIAILSFIFIYFFNYKSEFTGGGIFFHFSSMFNNNLIFYFIFILSFIFLLTIIKNNPKNLIIFILLLLMNPQLTIYHKYYDPLVLIVALLLLDIKLKDNIFKSKNLLIFYLHSFLFLFLNIIK